MRQKIKPAALLLICLLFVQSMVAQLQENILDNLKQSLIGYTLEVPREELYVHTDRETYIAGEIIWFTAYLIDRQSLKPSINSSIAYFEILNPDNRQVMQKRILLNEGMGPGQIVLPDSLSTGTYTLRAYTSWMKNFLPDNCFIKELNIYNSISSKVFKEKVSVGNPIKKETGTQYSERIHSNPVTLQANNSGPDYLEIGIISSSAFRSANNDLLHILIQTRGNINLASTENLTGDTTRIRVQKALLDEGINQITIFNAFGKPMGEKYVFSPVKANILSLHVTDSLKKRARITLDLALGNEAAASWTSSNISISIAPVTNAGEYMDMIDYMILGTEFGRLALQSVNGRRINELPEEVMDSLLIHLSSNWIDWEKISSADQRDFKYPLEKTDHFLFGKLYSGDQQSAGPGEVLLLCRPGKEAGFQYTTTETDGSFSFRIPVDEGMKDLIIMPENPDKNYKIIMKSSFSDPDIQTGSMADPTNGTVPPYIAKMSVNHQVKRIYGISSQGSQLDPALPPLKQKRFYGKPDYELIMADYVSLPLMEEVFFELLPYVSLKKRNTGYEIMLADRVDNTPYITSPCLMIDGVITRDATAIADMDPDIVERIDVIKEKYIVGRYVFNSIVNVITKAGDYSCFSLPDYMIRLPYRITDPVVTFISPEYTSTEMLDSRIPDYRNTLYWNPAVRPEKDGTARIECWSSDNSSDYVIHIQGITKEGKMISERKEFRVY